MKIKVVFYRYREKWPETTSTERIEFIHEFDTKMSDYDNYAEAFDKACRLGHRPTREIKFFVI